MPTARSHLSSCASLGMVVIAILSWSAYADFRAPRQGPISVVEVTAPDSRALDHLVSAGYDISNVRGHTVTIHATSEEVARLRATGYALVVVEAPPGETKSLSGYHTYTSLRAELQDAGAAHPDICRLTSIGASIKGRRIWAMLISDNPDVEEDEPEFKYVSTIHGDEPVGAELCLRFIHRVLDDYGTDTRITNLVDSTAIWVVPLMNPDGFEAQQRFNTSGYDLNRSFPAYPEDFTGTIFDGAPLRATGRPPEVRSIMQWTAENSFALSASFHTGALVVNYPYDDDGKPSGVEVPTPDDSLFQEISMQYSAANPPMGNNPLFPDGITNGGAWYVIAGGMQDWNYRYAGCNEVTIEVSESPRPPASALESLWGDNEESMLRFAESVHIGVRGIVRDRAAGQPLYAEVRVAGNDHPVYTDPEVGDYHRMLLPGVYTLEYSAPGYVPKTIEDLIVTDGEATRADVSLIDADVNDDGVVDASDVQFVINAILGYDVPYNCDLDGGGVTSTDLQLIVDVVLGRQP